MIHALLDEEVETLQALVGIAQAERQALMTFETKDLARLVDAKEALLACEDGVRRRREAWLASAGAATLPEYIAAQPAAEAARLSVRRDQVRALLGALTELNQLSLVQAARQLRWVRARRRALGGGPSTYGRRGHDGRALAGFGLNAVV